MSAKFRNIETGVIIEGEFYNSAQTSQKGVVTVGYGKVQGNGVRGHEGNGILLVEGDFIEHTPNGYYEAIRSDVLASKYILVPDESEPPANDPVQDQEPAPQQSPAEEPAPKKRKSKS